MGRQVNLGDRSAESDVRRVSVRIRGAVQGVGFRPFIYRMANELGLAGWIVNSAQGVVIEVEGEQAQVEAFILGIEKGKPPRAFIQGLEVSYFDPVGYDMFEIRHSEESGKRTVLVLPDMATCPDCLHEIQDPEDRRYRYPFTNCTNCGPRFSIIESLPYDRVHTTMKRFAMCDRCRSEYEDPSDRRFHAQPNACSRCGPHLELWNCSGQVQATEDEALLRAVEAIRMGRIVAVKGLGGFHLMADAGQESAVVRLRQRKQREEKPLALMYPSLVAVREDCVVSLLEERLMLSPECPIVLLRRRQADMERRTRTIAPSVAPGNPYLGIMLPYTPLHHLLLSECGTPVVATSGNLSDEPICTEESDAMHRLGDVADVFLIHDRPIARHVDDSIVRVMMGRELVLRRARGYAPLPVALRHSLPTLLAVGGHLKNTIASSVDKNVFLSQHIGDLETMEAYRAFERVISSFTRLYDLHPTAIACDAHPDYVSTRFAGRNGLPVIAVQHHYAHVRACMAENDVEGSVCGVAWDGTGYGLDGTVWGGEFFHVTESSFSRVGHFRTFRLPGGEKAIKEPRRSALGLLAELLGDSLDDVETLAPLKSFPPGEIRVLRTMVNRGINAPLTSSAGRVFDAVASLTGLRQTVRFEGQAAMDLEFALDGIDTEERYTAPMLHQGDPAAGEGFSGVLVFDWGPMVEEILVDVSRGVPVGLISARFHNTLVEVIISVSTAVGLERVVLSGGCFQNKYLTERAVDRLCSEGFRPYWHQRVPPNDGGIALGQIVAAALH